MRRLVRYVPSVAICAAIVSHATDDKSRFVQFDGTSSNTVYDLDTVRAIQPGRFSVVSTEISHPDVMEFELKALDILRGFCARAPGKYQAPTKLFSLGRPDLAVEKIEVNNDSVFWNYPYSRLGYGTGGPKPAFYICRSADTSEAGWFLHQREEITNGVKTKHVFDCERGLSGLFYPGSDDPARAVMRFVTPGTVGEAQYFRVCFQVTGKPPYVSNRKATQ